MARIPQAELDRVKREVDLAELVREAGVELKGRGDALLGLCPFHADTKPSLVVTPSKNLWACKGECDRGGSVVDWVMASEGVGFRHAVEILMQRLGLAPVEEGFRAGPSGLPSPLLFEAPDEVVLSQVVDYYHAVLKRTPDAQGYLKRRGIWDPDAVRTFKIGFVDRTLGLRLPRRNAASGVQIRDQLKRLGICKDTGHELLRGCVTFPVLDERGQVAQVYGRRVDHHSREGRVSHLYLPGPRRGVFNLSSLRATKEVILAESVIDALTFWTAGFRNVTAAWGAGGLTDEHVEAFKAYGIERALIAFDRDAAGDQGARKAAERLAAEGISCWRVLFPRGMDANAYALKIGPASQSLAVLLRAAEHLAGPVVTRSARNLPPEPTASSLAAAPPPAASEPQPPLPAASPEPSAPRLDVPAEVGESEVVIRLGERRWRIRGLERNLSFEQLRVNLLVSRPGSDAFHVDTFDLYSARQRGAFVRQAAAELGVKPDELKADLGKVLLKLEQVQAERIADALEPKPERPVMSEQDRAEALALLSDPDLLERISADLDACGLVGEHTNRLVCYLAAVSRKLDRPLAVLIQSSSAAGKSALMNAVLSLVPEEERVIYSAMTGQSLFYLGSTDLEHKVLAIAEDEGADKAGYPLKLLLSEGELSIASTGKDPSSGRLVTQSYHVQGPTALLTTTTAVELDEELQNRCVVLTVDESREQTRAIHRRQREEETLEGWRRRCRRGEVVKLHQNAQRLLRPLGVVNRWARGLTYPDSCTRTRRDNAKYLALMRAVALLGQHQREVCHDRGPDGRDRPYVEVTLDDIELANRLADDVLGRSLDELTPQTRRLLELLHGWVSEQCRQRKLPQSGFRFTRRQVREALGWSDAQVRKHLERLVDLEYALARRGGPGSYYVYELLWDGKGVEGGRFCMGLIDVDALREAGTSETVTPSEKTVTPSAADPDPRMSPASPPVDPPVTPCQVAAKSSGHDLCDEDAGTRPEERRQAPSSRDRTYDRAAAASSEEGAVAAQAQLRHAAEESAA